MSTNQKLVTKRFAFTDWMQNALFLVRSTGEIYYTNIVRGYQLADEWVHLCWGSWENVPDDDFESIDELVSDLDSWRQCDGKPVYWELQFEDGCMEFYLIDEHPANITAALEAVLPVKA